MQSFKSLTRSAPMITRSLLTPTILTSSLTLLRPTSQFNVVRSYSAEAGLTREIIQSRILEVLTSFEKVDPVKVTPTASFTTALGLDSLDAVEVVMAIEEEFSIEIPDEEADRITTVGEAIDYISKSPEAH